MDKNKALDVCHIITSIQELNRVQNILDQVIMETDDGNITISSNAFEEKDFFTTDKHEIVAEIRAAIVIRISELEKQLEAL